MDSGIVLYPRDYYERRRSALKTERASFVSHWMELSQFLQPRMGRYFITDRNRGSKRYQSIINSQGTQSARAARAGLLAGVMSPTRPWFNLTTPDPDMMEYQPVTEWLYKVETLLRAIFASSNLYNMAPVLLLELLTFGTAAMSQVDDFNNVARFFTHTVGSYMLAQNDRYEVDTMIREFQMTVEQLVRAYGKNVSPTVQNFYDRGNYDAWVDVVHVVEPNSDFDPNKFHSKFKKFRSVYYEPGSPAKDLLLSDKGFDEFPVHCPRWDVTGEDIYATDCPGMTALGDVKGLQALERKLAEGIERMANPPLKGPASLKGKAINSLPGGTTLYTSAGGDEEKLGALYSLQLPVNEISMLIGKHEERIKHAFYEDLFRSIDSMEGVQPQNQLFLSMKNAEKLLQLGPVLERIHGEFLNSMVDRTFAQCQRAGLLPPAPQELQGQPLRVRYISSLAMAQREVATQGIDKLTMFIGGLAPIFPTVADGFDADEALRFYGGAIGTPPKLLVPQDKIAAVRQHREQQASMQQAAAMASQGAQAVNQLANSPMPNGGNALSNAGQALAGAPPK